MQTHYGDGNSNNEVYVPLEQMTHKDWKFNVERLANEAYGNMNHAVALGKWGLEHGGFEDETVKAFVESHSSGEIGEKQL